MKKNSLPKGMTLVDVAIMIAFVALITSLVAPGILRGITVDRARTEFAEKMKENEEMLSTRYHVYPGSLKMKGSVEIVSYDRREVAKINFVFFDHNVLPDNWLPEHSGVYMTDTKTVGKIVWLDGAEFKYPTPATGEAK